ncbi:MAG TPA: glucose-6-phosphate isomerase [Oceanipulchritudo sp.]|nr:glucose-6-phosphate isomerase [Oceanipulchritudo sp.]
MSWKTFTENTYVNAGLDFTLDYSLMGASSSFFEEMEPRMQTALSAMRDLEAGTIANPDENRMVGHYWLRAPHKAPEPAIQSAIGETLDRIEAFAGQVHRGEIQGAGGAYRHLLVIGIGGSALGPQFVAQALGQPGEDRLQLHFFDNTDPDGIDLTLANLRGQLDKTLAVVISKSGGTPETRNGMLEAIQAYMTEGIEFASQAVAITGEGSKLDQVALEEDWVARFPMWDWVGGRTSELAAVGLFPAALQGLDIRGMLKGAAAMDELTLNPATRENPAALLALLWYHATNGKGEKDMVILPYKDRLMLFSKYLQQLIMESIGKEKDLDGNIVHQGIAVYGNKGSTDQHAYVQQLREGVSNFFATFIEVKKDREGASIDVEDGITSGDFLHAFLLGTRAALAEMNRPSLTISIDEVNARSVGMLIALYERAVGYYASLVNINAYHQPGVEAGKKAAAGFLKLQAQLFGFLAENKGRFFSVPEIAAALKVEDQAVTLFKLLEHAILNPSKGITKKLSNKPFDSTYGVA